MHGATIKIIKIIISLSTSNNTNNRIFHYLIKAFCTGTNISGIKFTFNV